MTAMTQLLETTLAASQVAFIDALRGAFDGTPAVLSGTPNSGRPLPGDYPGSSPRNRQATDHRGWLESKRGSHCERGGSASPSLRQMQPMIEALTAA